MCFNHLFLSHLIRFDLPPLCNINVLDIGCTPPPPLKQSMPKSNSASRSARRHKLLRPWFGLWSHTLSANSRALRSTASSHPQSFWLQHLLCRVSQRFVLSVRNPHIDYPIKRTSLPWSRRSPGDCGFCCRSQKVSKV